MRKEMVDAQLRLIQRLREDTAYTFKSLQKEADWLKYKLYFGRIKSNTVN